MDNEKTMDSIMTKAAEGEFPPLPPLSAMRKNSVVTVEDGVLVETPIIKSVPNPNLRGQTYVHPFAKSGMPEREHRHMQTLSEARSIQKAYDEKPIARTTVNGSLDRPGLSPITKSQLGGVANAPIRKGMDPRDAVKLDWANFYAETSGSGQYL